MILKPSLGSPLALQSTEKTLIHILYHPVSVFVLQGQS